MATTTRRPLPTLKVKKLPPPRLPSPEKSTTNTTKNGRNLDPLEKRLLAIRLHLLHNTKRRQQNPSEPTLVFGSFLYMGGLKSLSNKVSVIFSFFINLFFSLLDSSYTSENHSYSIRCFYSTSPKCFWSKYQTSLFKSR
jgi:hypothetical protein